MLNKKAGIIKTQQLWHTCRKNILNIDKWTLDAFFWTWITCKLTVSETNVTCVTSHTKTISVPTAERTASERIRKG